MDRERSGPPPDGESVKKPRLLLINKFYHDVGPAGGVGRYVIQEEEDLTAAGWEVVPFAMADADARSSRWDRFFVRARDYSAPRWHAGDAAALLWNREAAARLDALIREARPDVAHLHNIYHHLSPSLLPVLASHRVPVVMTLHDLRLLCPAIHMLRDGEICERCRGGRFHHAVLGRCVKGSRAASLLAAVETAHQRWRGLYTGRVATFVCPSRFYRDKFRDWGFPADKLVHLPNFVDLGFWHPDRLPETETRDAYVYFGRISQEKGLRHLLEAQSLWEQAHADGTVAEPPLRLLVAGDGPCLGNLRAAVARLGLHTVDVLGPLGVEDLRAALARARFSVLPSVWYENAPMAALESLAAGVPVVGSDVGGVPEIVGAGHGAVCAPGEPRDLQRQLVAATAWGEAERQGARAWAEKHADRARHMAELAGILARAAGLART